ncbi:Uncharacterized protein Fot_56529 [Forsythia ovata]|uniref:Uncharacterized protein n=1 Tax=Forsythia ovata TaxID=205694 RepID=A0ABD1P1A8_9LAMI
MGNMRCPTHPGRKGCLRLGPSQARKLHMAILLLVPFILGISYPRCGRLNTNPISMTGFYSYNTILSSAFSPRFLAYRLLLSATSLESLRVLWRDESVGAYSGDSTGDRKDSNVSMAISKQRPNSMSLTCTHLHFFRPITRRILVSGAWPTRPVL